MTDPMTRPGDVEAGLRAFIEGFHLTDGCMDAMNAALSRTFPIYSDDGAGTDIDGDAVTMLDALRDYGYFVISGATLDAARAAHSSVQPVVGGLDAAVESLLLDIRDVRSDEPPERMIPAQHRVQDIRQARAALLATRIAGSPVPCGHCGHLHFIGDREANEGRCGSCLCEMWTRATPEDQS